MSGQQDQPPVPASPVEPKKARFQQRPKFVLKERQQDDSKDSLEHNADEKETRPSRKRWQKSKPTSNEEQDQQQPQPSGAKFSQSRRSQSWRTRAFRSQTKNEVNKDKMVVELDVQNETGDVRRNGGDGGVMSNYVQPVIENSPPQQQQQPQEQSNTAKKPRKKRPKKKNVQKNEVAQIPDPQNHPNQQGESSYSPEVSADNPEKSTSHSEESMAKSEQPTAENSEVITSTEHKRKDQKKKKTRERKANFKDGKEADGSKELRDTGGSEMQKKLKRREKQKGRKAFPEHQADESKGVKTEGPTEQKAAFEPQEKDTKPINRIVVEETEPIISKDPKTADEQMRKEPAERNPQQKFSPSSTSRVHRLARDRNMPIEITVYPPAIQRQRRKEINFDESWLYEDADLGEIHFASPSPDKKSGRFAEKVDQEFDAHNGGDRVLSELPLELPKKPKRQQQQPVPEKQKSIKQKPSKSPESYVHPDDRDPRHSRLHFSPYLSPEILEQGIQSGELIRGILRINKRNRMEAYVVPDTLDNDIFISGQRPRNRALDGDVVAVRMLDVDTIWERKKEMQRKRDEEKAKEDQKNGNKMLSEEEEEVDDDDDTTEEVDEDKDKPKYAGEIVGILDRVPNQTYAGTLCIELPGNKGPEKRKPKCENKKKDIRLVWLKPTDKRNPFIAVPIESAPPDLIENQETYSNVLFKARIIRWSIDSLYPFGRIITSIGPAGSVATETLAILSDNNIKDADFPEIVLKSLPTAPWSIPAKEYEKRRDLREERIFTIDPSTAKDLDDAVHVKSLENGTFEVGVHIADVSYFVKKNTPLNSEARERGTSTYLVDRVIPMLPSILCEQLCSLNPSVERLAFSVIWKMDQFGNILDTWFGRTIIKSCAKLAYDDAQSVIEGNGLPSSVTIAGQERQDIERDIMHLYKMSQHMRKRRFEHGALSINSIRLCFNLDDEGEPTSVWVYELKDANRLIEEFMLCANMSVAQKISSHYPEEALLRRHAPPLEKRLNQFLQHSESLGYQLDASSAGALQASFNAIESEQAKAVLTILAIKPMQRAKYFCTGALDIDKYGHYALNVPLYTHFTSPIRRYADVIVHRLLDAALRGEEKSGYNTKTVQKIALDCNRRSDGAKNAQEQNIQVYLARYLYMLEKTSGPIIRSAVVVHVNKEGFDVIVPEYGIEKRIPLDTLPIKSSKHDRSDYSLSVYWQKGVPVPSREDGSPTFSMELTDSNSDGDDESCPGIPVFKPSDLATLPSEMYDPATGMQQFKVFTKFDVLIKATTSRSPPIINVYPINPYV